MDETAASTRAPGDRRAVPPGMATLFIGLVLLATGIALSIRAEIGVAPFDVVTTGIVSVTGIEIGIAAMLTPLAFIALSLVLGGRMRVGTLLSVVLVGPVLGLVLRVLPVPEAMAPRVGLFAVGFVVLAAGITAVVVADVGPGPAELLMMTLHERGVAISPARTAIEVVSVAVGWAMGGQVGAGTVIFALLIGPVLQRFLNLAGFSSRVAEVRSDCASPGA
ncbi:MAG: hypothetical protein GX643_00535 [Acidimicrobiales bacterium]|nr:hypothetical protein [Acidimicrobiales bacterium]